MKKEYKIFGALFLVALLAIVLVFAKPAARAAKECRDELDNDGDGYIDYPDDPGCSDKNDRSELDPSIECDDGEDNDGDNTTDMNDGGCASPTDDDETNCGDWVCEGGETQENCPEDCGYPTTTTLPPTTTTLPPTTTTLPPTTTTVPADSCGDTDGGFVITTQGTVSGYEGGSPYEYTDYCNDTSILVEYYCVGSQWDYGFEYCPINFTQCSNGACV